MSFSDPITINLNSGAVVFNLVSNEGRMKKYRSANGLDELIISHSETRRNRRTVRLNRTIVTADPFIPANNVEVSYSAYLVIDEPVTGFTDAEITADLDTTDGLLWWLGSGTVMADLLAGES